MAWRRRALIVTVAVLGLAACSNGGENTAPSSTPAPDTATATTEPAADTPVTEPPDHSADDTTTTAATTSTIAQVSDTGVPGIDSDDVFCRAWSEFAGSFQVLAFASGAAADPVTARRAELAAAPAVVAAVAALDAAMPDELADGRDAFVDGLLGPFTRRAERARTALADAGITDADIDALGRAWIAQLAEEGLQDPNIDPAIPAELATAFDAAVRAFSADVPGIVMDPSLATNANASAVLGYLATNCPDQGILAGVDVVG